MLSLHEMFGSGRTQEKHHILSEDEIVEGIDELGVLLYGHEKNALWFGSRLSNEETRDLAPFFQNATWDYSVTSSAGFCAGMVWALEKPGRGVCVEAKNDEKLDHGAASRLQPSPILDA